MIATESTLRGKRTAKQMEDPYIVFLLPIIFDRIHFGDKVLIHITNRRKTEQVALRFGFRASLYSGKLRNQVFGPCFNEILPRKGSFDWGSIDVDGLVQPQVESNYIQDISPEAS